MPSTTTPGNPGPRTRASTAGKTTKGKKTADPRETRSAVQATGNREEPYEPEEPASPSLRVRPRGPVQIATAPATTSSRKARAKRPEVSSQPADEEDDFEQTFGRPKNLFPTASAPVLGSAKTQEKCPDDLSEDRTELADEYDHSEEEDGSEGECEDDSELAVNRTITALLQSFKSINSKKEPQRKTPTPSKSAKSTKSTKSEQEPIYNYVYETTLAKDSPVLYKFGMSGDPFERRKDIKKKCKYVTLREVRSTIEEHPSMSARMTETLIHAELRRFKHNRQCGCKVKHREYFCVSKDVALQAHKRWVTFCRKEPWGSDGKLLPFWEDRLQKKQKLEKNCGYDGLAASWEEFTRPSEFDRQLWDTRDQVRQRTWWLKLVSSVAFAEAAIIALLAVQWPSALLVSLGCLSGCFIVWKWEGGPEPDAVQSVSGPQEPLPTAKQVAGRKAAKKLSEKSTDDSPARLGDTSAAPIVIGDDQEEVAELAADEELAEPTDPPALGPEDEEGVDDSGISVPDDEADNPEKWSGDEMDWMKDDEVNRSTNDEMDLSTNDEMDLSKATEILGLEQRLGSVNLGDRLGSEREGFVSGSVHVGGTSVPVAA